MLDNPSLIICWTGFRSTDQTVDKTTLAQSKAVHEHDISGECRHKVVHHSAPRCRTRVRRRARLPRCDPAEQHPCPTDHPNPHSTPLLAKIRQRFYAPSLRWAWFCSICSGVPYGAKRPPTWVKTRRLWESLMILLGITRCSVDCFFSVIIIKTIM